MNRKFLLLAICLLGATATVFSQKKQKSENKTLTDQRTKVEILTDSGRMVVVLYDSTPLHKANFIHLVKSGFYDSLLFHRIIEGFMIQGGDPESKYAADGVPLGNGSAPGNRIPAEFSNQLFHKKGALAAARDNNPMKESSNCQFYIVQGKIYTDSLLNMIECSRVRSANPNFYYTDAQRTIYKTIGGTPFLDQNYTVFGELIEGFDVLDKIASVPKAAGDRPVTNMRMRMKLIN